MSLNRSGKLRSLLLCTSDLGYSTRRPQCYNRVRMPMVHIFFAVCLFSRATESKRLSTSIIPPSLHPCSTGFTIQAYKLDTQTFSPHSSVEFPVLACFNLKRVSLSPSFYDTLIKFSLPDILLRPVHLTYFQQISVPFSRPICSRKSSVT